MNNKSKKGLKTMKKSNIKILDIHHEVNGEEYIVIRYVYKNKEAVFTHNVEDIKFNAKDGFEISETEKRQLSTIRKVEA